MVGDNECEGLKKERIGLSAAKPSPKGAGSSTTRESILKTMSMKNSPRAPGLMLNIRIIAL